MHFTPFTILTTERLVLRQLEMSDDKALFSLRADEGVYRYIPNLPHASIDVTREAIRKIHEGMAKNDSMFWVISLKNDPRLIGTICFWNMVPEESKAEVGYLLHPAFHGKGFMHEALSEVLTFGFRIMGLKTVVAFTHRENIGSIRLLEKNGFLRREDLPEDSENEEIVFNLENNL